ncbi:MAG: dihydrolipoyl dehydrogenase [Chlorobium sp.]|nr:dihydrolipoyl dehydrogenase [Chlorobium sp.]
MDAMSESSAIQYDLAVIGSGPGGSEAAMLGARAGLKVCIIEKSAPGGVCVNWGCIPTKALLRSAEIFDSQRKGASFGVVAPDLSFDLAAAVKRSRTVAGKMSKGVAFMLRKAGVDFLQGEAVFLSSTEVDIVREGGRRERIKAKQSIIATGGRSRSIPGLEPDGRRVITSREALALTTLPASMLVLGGGAIGVELAWFYATAGVKVTIVEMADRLLPQEDGEISEALRRSLEKGGIRVVTGAKLENVAVKADGVSASLSVEGKEGERVAAEYLLVAVGVGGNTEGLGLEASGVVVERGFVVTDASCRTAVPNIYAIGDVRGGMLLAHKAALEAEIALRAILGEESVPLHDSLIPRCVYAEPSIASIGLSEEQALLQGLAVSIGRASFAASGKANAYGNLEGMVKLIFSAEDGRMLGGHCLGHGAVELIGELALACSLPVTAGQLTSVVHAHPTLSESIREAAMQVSQG